MTSIEPRKVGPVNIRSVKSAYILCKVLQLSHIDQEGSFRGFLEDELELLGEDKVCCLIGSTSSHSRGCVP